LEEKLNATNKLDPSKIFIDFVLKDSSIFVDEKNYITNVVFNPEIKENYIKLSIDIKTSDNVTKNFIVNIVYKSKSELFNSIKAVKNIEEQPDLFIL
jgi:hypothetical protein